ncbi:diacylglycerol/lipid kinase family protein [Ornithinimicrobium flavum]|uniref:diacylglycerol/lipid kinase family protein n=1 Tax=Ornithinimicrobium flavum TaxID=1288636 RepID=UPI00107009BE|nr:diacylglycerol kinase family protein [Ornithinimicrobium flavum]
MRYAVARGRRTRRHRGGTAALGAAAAARLRSAGHEVTEVVTDSLEHARARCGALVADGLDVLAVAGGDGAVSLGADLCAVTSTALAILPSGTGNDSARSLGLVGGQQGTGPLQALMDDRRRRIDTLHVPELDRHVLGSVPAALDARISARANAWPRHLGPLTYTLSALVEIALLRRQPPLRYTLTVDDRRSELEALVVVPANLPYFGGGLPIAPDADPADGLLDLVVITPVAPLEALRLLRAVRAGRHADHPAVTITRARRVHLEGPSDIVAQADGDELGPLPLTVQVSPSSLQVVAPPLT